MQISDKFRLAVLGSITVLALTIGSPAVANASVLSDKPGVTLTAEQSADIAAIEVASVDGVFDSNLARSAGATDEAAAAAAAVFLLAGWTVLGSTSDVHAGTTELAQAALACTGSSGYNGWFFPWGSQFGVNSCLSTQLIAALGLGAAGAGAVTAVLVAIGASAVAGGVAGLVAALLAVGASAIAACQAFSSNRGIWLNLGGTPAASCWGQ